jgi:hypothetical protein
VSTLEARDADRYQSFTQYDAENLRQTSSHGRRPVVAADDGSVRITEIERANFSFGLSSRRKRTSAPGTTPGLRAANLGGHRDDRIHRHAAVQPYKRSGGGGAARDNRRRLAQGHEGSSGCLLASS